MWQTTYVAFGWLDEMDVLDGMDGWLDEMNGMDEWLDEMNGMDEWLDEMNGRMVRPDG